jgi:hypothetical protein
VENLAKDFKKPCIMDVKIQANGPDASGKKKAHQDASYAGTKKPFVFSVPAEEKKEEVIMKGKEYWRSLDVDNIHELLGMYEPEAAKELAKIFVEDPKNVLQLFQHQTTFHFFASFHLFV